MIELLIQGIERCLEVRKIADPAGLIYLAAHMNFDPERVPVQPGASMLRWNIRQPVRRLKPKLLEDLHLFQV